MKHFFPDVHNIQSAQLIYVKIENLCKIGVAANKCARYALHKSALITVKFNSNYRFSIFITLICSLLSDLISSEMCTMYINLEKLSQNLNH